MQSQLLQQLQDDLGTSIKAHYPVHGGDINQAYALETAGRKWFVKYNKANRFPLMFEKEAAGLAALRSTQAIKIPAVERVGQVGNTAYLLMPFVESGQPKPDFWQHFGRQLAQLHRQQQPHFGFKHSNYIGSLVQPNESKPDWASFYTTQRLMPQVWLAEKYFSSQDLAAFEQLYQKLPNLCPEEPPALIHGDLWSGNYMVDAVGMPMLIDPAVAYAHREMDLAMMQLFGGFDSSLYASYQEVYPLAPSWQSRLPLYQLYYLLVHLNLFGQSYLSRVQRIIHRYA